MRFVRPSKPAGTRPSNAPWRRPAPGGRRQRARAEAGFATARKAVDESFTTISESRLLNVPGLQPLRLELLRSALTFYEGLLRERTDDPALGAELLATRVRVGRILGDLGRTAEARAAFRAAVEGYEQALRDRPDDPKNKAGLGEALYLSAQGEDAAATLRRAVAIWRELIASHPDNPAYRKQLADADNMLAMSLSGPGSEDETLELLRNCVELRLGLAAERPDDPDALKGLAESFNNLMFRLPRTARRQMASMMQQALAFAEAAARLRPEDLELSRAVAILRENLAAIHWSQGRKDDAIGEARIAHARERRLALDNHQRPRISVSICTILGLALARPARDRPQPRGPAGPPRGGGVDRPAEHRQPRRPLHARRSAGQPRHEYAAVLFHEPRRAGPAAPGWAQREGDGGPRAGRRGRLEGSRPLDGPALVGLRVRVAGPGGAARGSRPIGRGACAGAGRRRRAGRPGRPGPVRPRPRESRHDPAVGLCVRVPGPAVAARPGRPARRGARPGRPGPVRSRPRQPGHDPALPGTAPGGSGAPDQAAGSLRRALVLREELVREHPEEARHVLDLAATYAALLETDRRSGPRAADPVTERKGLEAMERAVALRPNDPDLRGQRARLLRRPGPGRRCGRRAPQGPRAGPAAEGGFLLGAAGPVRGVRGAGARPGRPRADRPAPAR